MNLLPILTYPDKRLRTLAKPIKAEDFTPELDAFIDRMFATMYEAPGIGLAATQVDFHKQLIVIDVSDEKNEPLVLINPSYKPVNTTQELMQEGCLSVPEYTAEVERHLEIEATFLDRQGKEQTLLADGLLAHCIQHECDHLKGIVFVDYLSKLKQDRLKKKYAKLNKAS